MHYNNKKDEITIKQCAHIEPVDKIIHLGCFHYEIFKTSNLI